jgi:NHL repeat-containing protein
MRLTPPLARALVACLALVSAVRAGGGPAASAENRVAADWRLDVVVTQIPRPAQLAFTQSGRLVVLSHGWRGDAAGEIFEFDLSVALPIDGSRAPRIVIPFADGPRKAVFGSLAVSESGDLFLGEENGNRVSRLSRARRLDEVAVGVQHLVGGGAIALDRHGRLIVVDYASPETRLRSETPLPPALEAAAGEGYQGPLVFRVDLRDTALPRRLDLVPPLFPRAWTRRPGDEPLSRFISVAPLPGDDLLLLDSLGQLFHLTPGAGLRRLARLPAGHYHRTNIGLGPDGSAYISSGFHIRGLYRVSPAGVVTSIARELGDPAGIAVDPDGAVYVAETALHRIIRLKPE